MDITLNITSQQLANEDLQDLTRKLCEDIKTETNMIATLPFTNQDSENSKGNLVELGAIVLTFLSNDSIIVLVEMIKERINREPSIEIEIKTSNNSIIKVNAKNKNSKEVENIITQLTSVINND